MAQAPKTVTVDVVPVIKDPQPDPVPALRRIVLYATTAGTVRPAIITRVNEDETVDLSVFNSEGCVPVRSAEPGDAETPGTYFWE